MADGWGRLTGTPGIAMVTGGPGHVNAVGALFAARAAESPMVLLSGHAATWELGRGGFQELRQAEMAAPVTKASWTATSTATLGQDIARAIRIAREGRPGPVHISVPSDLLDEVIDASAISWPQVQAEVAAPDLPPAIADSVIAAIHSARRPDHLCATSTLERWRSGSSFRSGGGNKCASRHTGKSTRACRCRSRRLSGLDHQSRSGGAPG